MSYPLTVINSIKETVFVEFGDYRKQINGKYMKSIYLDEICYKYVFVFKRSIFDYLKNNASFLIKDGSACLCRCIVESLLYLYPNTNIKEYNFIIWCQAQVVLENSDFIVYRYQICNTEDARNELRIGAAEFVKIAKDKMPKFKMFDIIGDHLAIQLDLFGDQIEWQEVLSEFRRTDKKFRNVDEIIQYVKKNCNTLSIYPIDIATDLYKK